MVPTQTIIQTTKIHRSHSLILNFLLFLLLPVDSLKYNV